jgi:hypothetical protein
VIGRSAPKCIRSTSTFDSMPPAPRFEPQSHKPSERDSLGIGSSAQGYAPTVSTSRAEVNAVQAQTQTTQEQDRCQVLSDHRGNGHGQRHPAVSSREIVNNSSQQHVQQPAPYQRTSFCRKRTDNSATGRNRFPAEWAALYMCSYLLPAIRAAAGFACLSLCGVGHYNPIPNNRQTRVFSSPSSSSSLATGNAAKRDSDSG